MVYRSRDRKRVRAPLRGPDGSAYQKCENCGINVAISLADMHDCGVDENTTKKMKTQCVSEKVERQRIEDQPRSAFHFFMEEFVKTCEEGNEIEKNKKGCETWKSMPEEERLPFVRRANELNSAYAKLLAEEENEMQRVDDEADSAEVGKYDKNYEDSEMYFYDSGGSGGSGLFLSDTYEDLDDELLITSTSEKFREDQRPLLNPPGVLWRREDATTME